MCLWVRARSWLLIGLGVSAASIVVIYLGSYIFLLFVDRDALRSESYTLSKLAIVKGLVGDNISGLRRLESGPSLEPPSQQLIPMDGDKS
jgi:hypothetical protein